MEAGWTVNLWTLLGSTYGFGIQVTSIAYADARYDMTVRKLVEALKQVGISAKQGPQLADRSLPGPVATGPKMNKSAPIRMYVGSKP